MHQEWYPVTPQSGGPAGDVDIVGAVAMPTADPEAGS
jgi:hypothetical protein